MKKRALHDLSFYKLLTCNMGTLVPIGIKEVLPGDTFQHSTSMLIRTNPLNAPVMHPVHAKIHHWFVPTRLIWEDFEKFITGGPDGNDASVAPTITLDTTTGGIGTLHNHLGVPVVASGTLAVSALPARAYNLIFNENYRDQDLVTALVNSKASGSDTTSNTTIQNAAWEKDYFTTCRSSTQKGPEVTIPLGTTAPVFLSASTPSGNPWLVKDSTNQSSAGTTTFQAYSGELGVTGNTQDLVMDPNGTLFANLATASAATINTLRRAFAIQRFEEARSRWGSRYTEYLAYLGVKASDARLQRPEYLGGGSQTIQFSEVLQTALTTDGDPSDGGPGDLYGHGIGAMRSNRYRRFFEEHGYVVSLMTVRPKTMYVQGLPRMWSRATKLDYWQPELQHIGQQAVLNKELYAAHASPNSTFGYQDRYDEYRRSESYVSGEFASTLNYWHMARIFSSDPALNASFVTSNPTNRIFQDTSSDTLLVMANHRLRARRLLASTGSSFIY